MLDAKSPPLGSRGAGQRLWLPTLAAVACLVTVTRAAAADPSPAAVLLSVDRHGNTLRRVTSVLEVEGHLQVQPDGKTVTQLPLKVTGKSVFDERLLDEPRRVADDPMTRSVRQYERAEAEIQVGRGQPQQSRLPDDKRLIIVERAGGTTTIFSPTAPLTREQLELVDTPGNCLLLPALLPDKTVTPGQPWDVSAEALLGLMGWDAVERVEVQGTLSGVERGSATIDFAGTASGKVRGVASDVELKAKCLFDAERRQIKWLGVAMREKRAISLVEPGFEVTVKLRVAIVPLTHSATLTADCLEGLPLAADEGSELLRIESDYAACRLLADRGWFLTSDMPDAMILRRIHDGELIAQCNIMTMPDLAAGKHVSLEEFQQDIQKTLGDNFGQFIEASQSRTEAGLRLLRVSAAGSVSDVPVQWIYYLISNEKGRRTALALTLDQQSAEKFAAADHALVSSFQFADRPEADPPKVSNRPKPAPASPN